MRPIAATIFGQCSAGKAVNNLRNESKNNIAGTGRQPPRGYGPANRISRRALAPVSARCGSYWRVSGNSSAAGRWPPVYPACPKQPDASACRLIRELRSGIPGHPQLFVSDSLANGDGFNSGSPRQSINTARHASAVGAGVEGRGWHRRPGLVLPCRFRLA